jgi:formylglycine-generating enzyme required for sulfatase activity
VGRRLIFALVASGLVACSLLFPVSDDAASDHRLATPDDAALGDSNRDDAAIEAEAPPLRCEQTGRGPTMVPAGDRLCIDSTEVTADQYAVFVEAGVAVTAQIDGCGDNTDFVPHAQGDAGNQPVQEVDWCDAYTFCDWAGKKLCGAMPGYDGGAPTDASGDAADAFSHGMSVAAGRDGNVNAWAWACKGGERDLIYPYGYRADASACNSFASDWPMVPVASFPKCEGGYPGLFDMVGNAKEWIDECEGGVCGVAGVVNCIEILLSPKQIVVGASRFGSQGFRCCGRDPPLR